MQLSRKRSMAHINWTKDRVCLFFSKNYYIQKVCCGHWWSCISLWQSQQHSLTNSNYFKWVPIQLKLQINPVPWLILVQKKQSASHQCREALVYVCTGVGFSAGRVMRLMYVIIGVTEGQCWILNEALGSGDKVPSHEWHTWTCFTSTIRLNSSVKNNM